MSRHYPVSINMYGRIAKADAEGSPELLRPYWEEIAQALRVAPEEVERSARADTSRWFRIDEPTRSTDGRR